MSSLIKKYCDQYAGLSWACWRGISFGFLQTSIGSVFYFLSIYFVDTMHYSVSESGLMISCYGLGAVSGGYFGGRLSDHVHPRLVISICLAMQAMAIFGLLVIESLPYLMGVLFLLGGSVYAFITSNYTHILSQCGDNESSRLKAINILSMSSNLGLGVSALMIGVFSGFGFDHVFFVSGLLLLLLSIHVVMSDDGAPKVRADSREGSIETSNLQSAEISKIGIILLCVLLAGLMIAQMSVTYPIYLEYKFPLYGVHGFSLTFAVNSLLVVLFQAPLVNYFGRFNKSLVMGAGGFLLGFGMFCFSFSSQFSFVMIACLVYTVGEMLFFSMAQLSCYQYAPKYKRGRSLGLFRMTFAASRMMGPMMGGYVFQHLGGDAVWYACGLLGVFCFTLCGIFV